MATKFSLVEQTVGYITRPDPTNTEPGTLVSGSQNVVINTQEKIQTRGGYEILGAENTARTPIQGSFEWKTSTGEEYAVRGYDDELEVYLGTVDGVEKNAWTRIEDGWSAVDFSFATWYDTSEAIDLLIFVNGDSNMYAWSGGVAIADSTTVNTITKKGTQTFGQNRFFTTGNKTLINVRTGTEFTYTGGEGTTTLTGVSPDPTSDIQDGDVLIQKIITNADTPAAGFDNDIISQQLNQIWVGSETDSEVYVSKDTDYTDYAFSSPRLAGEGALLTLDGTTKGFARQGQDMIIFSGTASIFKSSYFELDVSGTLAETLKIDKLKTTSNQTAIGPYLIEELGDSIAWLSQDKGLYILQNVENIEGLQVRRVSDPIQPDFDDTDFTNGSMKFHKDRLIITAPVDNKTFILEYRTNSDGNLTRFWQPPQILPVRRLAVIGDEWHGHSSVVAETYKLFTGRNDNDSAINAKAIMAYRNFGDVMNMKRFDQYAVNGFIRGNTNIVVKLDYDYRGVTSSTEKTIEGSNGDITFELGSGSLGIGAFGSFPLGAGISEDEGADDLKRFITILEFPQIDFHEYRVTFESNDIDQEWAIISQGPNASASLSLSIERQQ